MHYHPERSTKKIFTPAQKIFIPDLGYGQFPGNAGGADPNIVMGQALRGGQ